MKNLILIPVLAVVAFSTFVSATPANWRRDGAFRGATIPMGMLSLGSLVERQTSQCDAGYYKCTDDGPEGCCPNGTNCIPQGCDVPCTSSDTLCNSSVCCKSTETCTSVPKGIVCTPK